MQGSVKEYGKGEEKRREQEGKGKVHGMG